METFPTITMKCGTEVDLLELMGSDISYVPCTYETPLFKWGSLSKRDDAVSMLSFKMTDWQRSTMTGIQIFTGHPSNRDGEYLTDIDIERRLLEHYPQVCDEIVNGYKDVADTPCIIETKSGGLRLSAFCLYLDSKRYYEDHGGMLLEIFSIGSLSRIDDRYSQLSGSLYNLPSIPKSFLQNIHSLISEYATPHHVTEKVEPISVGSSTLDGVSIEWVRKGRFTESVLMSTDHCAVTNHQSNRDEVRFTRSKTGVIFGKCFNCGESWRVTNAK